jgi:hypothetical protein
MNMLREWAGAWRQAWGSASGQAWRSVRGVGLVAGLAVAVGLAACGGGGGGEPPAPPAPPPAPQISAQPQPLRVNDGASASFSVTASGTDLVYRWQRNGTDIAGAASAALALGSVTLADSGARLRVVVSNAGGSVTSNEATLTVDPVAPTITTAPAAATVSAGQSATFGVAASGSAPLTYQWLRNGVEIAGATAASHTTAALTLADSGAVYSVRVGNAGGSITSAAAALVVNPVGDAPVITAQPEARSVVEGQTATFSVGASGTAPLAYQWRRNDGDIAGATGASYTTPTLALADSGASYSVRVTNDLGSITSAAASLTVTAAPPGSSEPRLALSSTNTFARRGDGTLIGWGRNDVGQLGNGATVSGTSARIITSGVLKATANDLGGAVLQSAGTAQGWGTNESGWLGGNSPLGMPPTYLSPVALSWPRPVLALEAGTRPFDNVPFLFALLDDGTVWHMPGDRTIGTSDIVYAAARVPGLADIVALGGGHGLAYAVRRDGTLHQLTMFNTIGSGASWFRVTPTQVAGLSDVAQVSCGVRHCLALLRDGTLRAWGEGRSGELGHGVAISSGTPVVVQGLTGVTHIAVTSVFGASLARTADGRVWSWGSGELSARPSVRSGAFTFPPPDVSVPTEVPSLAGALEIACSDRHCAARRSNGTVWTWGNNLYGQLGNGTLPAQEPVQALGINLN